MIIRQEDLTPAAIELGIWNALLDLAKIDREDKDTDLVDIEIIKAKKG